MSGINYIPQYENLSKLEQVVRDLQTETNKSTRLKTNVVKQVDDIIRLVNSDRPDYTTTTKYIEEFLAKYDAILEERPIMKTNNSTTALDLTDQEVELRRQNSQLKEILKKKKQYNSQTALLNINYEQSIDTLIGLIQEKRASDEEEKLEFVSDVRMRIEREREEEWSLYLRLLKNDEVLFKLNRVLVETYGMFDEFRDAQSR